MPLEVTPASAPFPGATDQTHAAAPAILGLPVIARVPDHIREAAHRLDRYSPQLDADLNEAIFTDYGNLNFKAKQSEESTRLVGDACKAIVNTGAIPFFLARDSRFTASAVRATADRFPEITAIQLGARPNLLEEFENNKWHARCAMKRCLDRLPIQQIKHLGVRSGKKEEFDLLKEGDTAITAEELPHLGKNGIYLSFHLSIFDPHTAPGVTSPEPGGLNWEEFSKMIALIPWDRVKACDLVGLQPSGDHTGLSHLVAAKAAREIILSLAKKPAPQD